ncbi:MAG: hypothetical protein JWP09_681 [Candidatus Taylorbacteria bacterium]|nr:hypothetical protein [Candidatus Taylorbacteria bacterium]
MKTIWAVTHGKKAAGTNPVLNETGVNEILQLAKKLSMDSIKQIIIGTGARFIHTYKILLAQDAGNGNLQNIDPKYSPLLGSADSGDRGETGWNVLLTDGTAVPLGNYIGLNGTPGIDLWKFLRERVEDGALLVTGRELIGTLMGSVDAGKSATAYQITIGDEPGDCHITEVS